MSVRKRTGSPVCWMVLLSLLTAQDSVAAEAGQAVAATPEEWSSVMMARIPMFVEWPKASRLGEPNDLPITYCVVEATPVYRILRDQTEKQKIKSRSVRVLALSPGASLETCDVAYFGAMSETMVRQLLVRAGGQPLLTFGSVPEYLQLGVHVVFQHDKSHYYNINRESAEAAQLQISSRVLQKARNLTGKEGV